MSHGFAIPHALDLVGLIDLPPTVFRAVHDSHRFILHMSNCTKVAVPMPGLDWLGVRYVAVPGIMDNSSG